MILILVDQITPRLVYTFDFVFKERGYEYALETDSMKFVQAKGLKLNYSKQLFSGICQFEISTVLADQGLKQYTIQKSFFNTIECLSFDGITDIFASVFYVLSRMEEYYDSPCDDHGRFRAKDSVLYRFGWLKKAVCDRWSEAVLSSISKNDVNFDYRKKAHNIEICPTFDIDSSYAYKHKGIFRTILSFTKDLVNFDIKRLTERFKVGFGLMSDPFDTFDFIGSLSHQGFNVRLFWLLSDYTKNDKNIQALNLEQRKLIQKMHKNHCIGIHPGYGTMYNCSQLETEKNRLEKIIGERVNHSRQHFLRVSIPETYHCLLKCKITNDYTMGYAEMTGFRAGTAKSFQWFDITNNTVTSLTIHPFVYMDGTFNDYLKSTIQESKQITNQLYQEIKKFGGSMRFIWHNETVSNNGRWAGWNELLEYTLQLNNGKNDE